MEDQVRDLKSRNLPAACLHSNLSQIQRREVLRSLANIRLLYISPETLLSPPVWSQLSDRRLKITGLMLDEAHCLVQWGDSFRPSYRRLGAVRKALMQQKPDDHPRIAIAAFTATADLEATAELQTCLHLENPSIVRTSPYRPHLSLKVEIAWTPAGRKSRTLKFIRDRKGQSGLIYVRSRRDAEMLATWLQENSFATAAYHAGLPPQERHHIEKQWLTNQYPFVICTSAFGLGINKPDTRWVLHFHPPLTLSEYIQEIGRAGRDDRPAEALMLVSEPTGLLDNSDRQKVDFFLQQQQKLQQQALSILPKLPRKGSFAEATKLHPDAAIALGLLHRAGNLIWHDPFEYEILDRYPSTKPSGDHRAIAQMQAYIKVRGDRWAFLLNAFGFE
jgi:ATP-dependent DNA helicase RecQ